MVQISYFGNILIIQLIHFIENLEYYFPNMQQENYVFLIPFFQPIPNLYYSKQMYVIWNLQFKLYRS